MAPSKRTVLITGCSANGLGDQLARTFQEKGLRVIATARNPSKMDQLKNKGIETVALDPTSAESCSSAVDAVTKLTGGSLDILINNAGSGYNMPLMDVDIDKAKQVFEINVWGTVRVTQAFVPLLRNSTYPGGPMVVNHTSAASFVNNPLQGVYNMSKSAAGMFTETMRLELQPFGIKTIDLKSGSVASEFFTNQGGGAASTEGPKLPENSMYQPAREMVEKFLKDGPEVKHMPQQVWAEKTVGDLLKSNPATVIRRGTSATMTYILTSILPTSLKDSILFKAAHMDVLSDKVKHVKAQ